MLASLDIETSGLDRFTDRLLLIGVYSEQSGYLSFKSVEQFKSWHLPTNQYIGHNFKFDALWLSHLGLDLSSNFAYDTKSIASILTPLPSLAEGQRHILGLENLYIQLLGGQSYKVDRTDMSSLPYDELVEYNRNDCKITWDLFNYLVDKLDSAAWAFVESWLMPATRYCMELEANGVYVDKAGLSLYAKCVTTQRDLILKKLNKLTVEPRGIYHEKCVKELSESYQVLASKALVKAKDKEKSRLRYQALFSKAKEKIEPFNWNSPLQLQWLLGEYYGLDLFNKRSKKTSTDASMLASHAQRNEVARTLSEFREYEKLLSTCIPALIDNCKSDQRVHAGFNVGIARTGRLTSSNPNLQQVPQGPVRGFIKAPSGSKFFIADYSQVEPRIMAHLAGEQELINAFKEEKDIYSLIAINLFSIDCDIREFKTRFPKERGTAKTVGLSILYGTGAAKLQEVLKKDLDLHYSLKECKTFIEGYRNSFPQIKRFKDELEVNLANQKVIYNLLGRPVCIENNDDLYMTALNTMVQGSASDLVVRAAMEIKKAFPFVKPVMLIHDEMVFEIAEHQINDTLLAKIEEIATKGMEHLLTLSVPLKIEYTVSKEWAKP